MVGISWRHLSQTIFICALLYNPLTLCYLFCQQFPQLWRKKWVHLQHLSITSSVMQDKPGAAYSKLMRAEWKKTSRLCKFVFCLLNMFDKLITLSPFIFLCVLSSVIVGCSEIYSEVYFNPSVVGSTLKLCCCVCSLRMRTMALPSQQSATQIREAADWLAVVTIISAVWQTIRSIQND